MTSSGRRWAFLIGIVVAFSLPKRVATPDPQSRCEAYVTEPWGLYLVESVLHRDLGIAYTTGTDCR